MSLVPSGNNSYVNEGGGTSLANEVYRQKKKRLRRGNGILLDKNPRVSEKVQKLGDYHMNMKMIRFQEVGNCGPGMKAAKREKNQEQLKKISREELKKTK